MNCSSFWIAVPNICPKRTSKDIPEVALEKSLWLWIFAVPFSCSGCNLLITTNAIALEEEAFANWANFSQIRES